MSIKSMMMNKTSRRAFLVGTCGVLAGTTTALLVRRRRQKNQLPMSMSPYGKLPVDPAVVKSDLSTEEVKKAFDVFSNERDMWLRFKGISADVRVQTEVKELDARQPRVSTNQGAVSFRLKELESSRERRGPFEYQLTYFDPGKQAVLWKYVTDKKKNRQFAGKEIEGVDHFLLFAMLSAPVDLFSQLTNRVFRDAYESWRPYTNAQAKGVPGSYRFVDKASNQKMAEIAFEQGHISEFHSKRIAGNPVVSIVMKQPVLSNTIWYPTKIEISVEEQSGRSLKCHLDFSNVDVAVG